MTSLSRCAALSLLTAGLIGAAAAPLGAQTDAGTVRVGSMSIDAFGEAYYGLERGIFSDNGINMQVSTLPNGSTIIQAVLAGDLDAGMANTVQVATAVAHGIPLQVIAPASIYSSRAAYQQLSVARSSPFKTAKDLDGATIAVSTLHDFNEVCVEAWLARNGLPANRVHFVELKFAEMGPALARGTVQAAIITEPGMSAAIHAGEVRPFADVYSAVSPEFASVVWFATKSWLNKNPDAAKKLVNGIFATARWSNAHQQQTGEILAKLTKIDPALITTMKRAYFGTSNERKFVQGPLDIAARYGLLPRPVMPAELLAP